MRQRLSFVLIGGLGIGLIGCPAAPDPGTKDGESFSKDVQPIFTAACAGCHSAGGFGQVAGVPPDLSAGNAFASLAEDGGDHVLVVPGDAEASYLFEKIVSDTPRDGQRMPLFALPLSDAEIQTIRDWIDAGAPNN